MNNKSDEVLKSIPDFDEFMRLSDEISSLMYRKLTLEAGIKEGEANVFRLAYTDTTLFQGGKPASVAFIDNTYKFTGINNELVPLRSELSKVVSDLESKRLKMDVYKTMIEVWRTLCSNQRTAGM